MTNTITTGIHETTDILPDLPNTVHGIKQVGKVWAVQCDDCRTIHASTTPIVACGAAIFNNRDKALEGLRLCADCWLTRGWIDDPTRGWVKVA